MTERFYVAGASAELERAEAFMDALEGLGFENAHRWPDDIRAALARGAGANRGLSRSERLRLAAMDRGAVRSATFVVLLLPPPEIVTVGAWIEFGIALVETTRPVYTVGEDVERTIFTALAGHFECDAHAVDFFRGVAR